jgi:hypothetical protein
LGYFFLSGLFNLTNFTFAFGLFFFANDSSSLVDFGLCEDVRLLVYSSNVFLSENARDRLKFVQNNWGVDSLINLCMIIYHIEMNVSPFDIDAELFIRTKRKAQLVLDQLNKINTTNFK